MQTAPAAPASAPVAASPATPTPSLVPAADAATPPAVPPVETKQNPKENDPGEFAQRFAQLNKQAQKIRDEEKRIADIKKSMEGDYEHFQKWKTARDNKDAIALLESAGLTYNDATAKVLADKQLSMDEKVDLLLKKIEDKDKAEEARQLKLEEDRSKSEVEAAEAAVKNHVELIRSHIEAHSDQYELIKASDAHDTVMSVIEEYWNANEQILDMDEACKQVEAYLEEQIRPYMSLKKFSKESLPAEGKESGKSSPNSFTLTNQGTAAPAQDRSSGYLSDEESIKRGRFDASLELAAAL